MKLITYKAPLRIVKPVCIGAVIIGLCFVVSGRWPLALCMIVGSYLLEKNMYRCHNCNKRLDMKRRLTSASLCPECRAKLSG